MLLTSGYSEGAVPEAEAAGIRILPKPYHIADLAAALDAAKASFESDVKSKRSSNK